ncbi:tuftelin-interacting protein 11-like [Sarcoptes scabiei]|nr:tuftelin-interacting protein 11-like [Sarcoptes scabiei]
MPPSSIHFLYLRKKIEKANLRNDDCLKNQLDSIVSTGILPKKLQVTEKDGFFIALDNNSLQLMRDLEEMGFCNEVEVEIVPLSKVPPKIVKEIFNVHQKNSSEKRVGRRTNRLIENRNQNDDDDVRGESDKNGGGGDGDELNDDHQERNDRFRKTETKKINPNESDRKSTIIETKQISSSISSKPTTTSTKTTTTTTTKTSINMQTVSKIGTVSFLGNYGQLNTYLSDEQMKATRLTNTIVVMAPCLRQPITTSSTISSDNNSSSSSSSVSSSSPLSSAMIDTIDDGFIHFGLEILSILITHILSSG